MKRPKSTSYTLGLKMFGTSGLYMPMFKREGGRVDTKGAFYSEGEIRFFKSAEKIIPKNYPDLKI